MAAQTEQAGAGKVAAPDPDDIAVDDIAAATFSTTKDLDASFPAAAARKYLGWDYVALMSSNEMDVAGGQPKCIRVMVLVNTDRSPQEINNVYLRGAAHLRTRDGRTS